MRDDRAVLELIEGLTEVFGAIWRMAEFFWDLWKAWPRCLKVYEGWPSSSGTNGRLGLRVWRDWMGGQASRTYQRLGRRVWRDWIRGRVILWLIETTSFKRLDESPTCSVTYGGLGRRVWRGWMGGRRVMGGRAVLRLIEGLADVFEGVGWEGDVLWDLSKAWPMCLNGLHERSSCFGPYEGLGWQVWRDWMRARHVLRLMEGLADVFERVGWKADVLWDLCRAWSTCLKGLDAKPTCSNTYDITKGRSRVAKEKRLFIFF